MKDDLERDNQVSDKYNGFTFREISEDINIFGEEIQKDIVEEHNSEEIVKVEPLPKKVEIEGDIRVKNILDRVRGLNNK